MRRYQKTFLACVVAIASAVVWPGSGSLAQETGQDAAAQQSAPARKTATQGRSSSLNKSWEEATLRSPEFSQDVAEGALQRLAEGFRAHSVTTVQSLFQMDRFDANLGAQMAADFDFAQRFDVFYKIQAATPLKESRAEIVTDFEIQITPNAEDLASRHKRGSLRITVERIADKAGSGEWRIVAITPNNFLFEH